MLNSFPSLLIYSFFVPTLLRITAAIILFLIARHVIQNRKRIEDVRLPLVGRPQEWMLYVSAAVTFVVACLLFVGLFTQWAALISCLIALKHAFILKRYPSIRAYQTSTYLLFAVICFAVLILGAGAFAFDLPL